MRADSKTEGACTGRLAGAGALCVRCYGAGVPLGVPAAFTQHTMVLPFNDVDAVKAAFAANSAQIAGIIRRPFTPYLARPNMVELLKALLAHGANPNVRLTRVRGGDGVSLRGATPIFFAAASRTS